MQVSCVSLEGVSAVEKTRAHDPERVEYGNEKHEHGKERLYMEFRVLSEEYRKDGERKAKEEAAGITHEYTGLRAEIIKKKARQSAGKAHANGCKLKVSGKIGCYADE